MLDHHLETPRQSTALTGAPEGIPKAIPPSQEIPFIAAQKLPFHRGTGDGFGEARDADFVYVYLYPLYLRAGPAAE